ncbi:hypothetical protein K439DRAFT_1617668 [Ramaria rubella]|nr:hypothetical protein K439DRAFT_1617668 [Ramaria rubella]
MSPKTSKCMHSSLNDGTICHCPNFVPHPNPGEDEANICDSCRHTIAFHIDLEEPSVDDTSAKLEEILLSYSTQAASFGMVNKSPNKSNGPSQSSASSSKQKLPSKASDAHKEAVPKASKGKRKKVTSKDKKMFTKIQLVVILPYGLDTDGSPNHTIESSPPQIDKLVELGFANIGGRGVLKFGNDWDMQMLDDWLHETLLIVFEYIEALPATFDNEYAWRLPKTSRSHFELHRERPDGYDAISAKDKSKGWQDITRLPIPSITHALDKLSIHSHKGKGKIAAQKRLASEAYSNDDNTEYNTQSKKRKLKKDSVKSTVQKASNEHIYIVDSDSDKLEAATSCKSCEVKLISTPTLEAQFEDLEASIVGFHKRRHEFSSPPPTIVNPWSTKPETAV